LIYRFGKKIRVENACFLTEAIRVIIRFIRLLPEWWFLVVNFYSMPGKDHSFESRYRDRVNHEYRETGYAPVGIGLQLPLNSIFFQYVLASSERGV
jgi:hypothetical protein